MSSLGPFGIGGLVGSGGLSPFAPRQTAATGPAPASRAVALSTPHLERLVSDGTRDQLRNATASLRAAFGALTTAARPTYATSLSMTPGTAASVTGSGAKVAPLTVSLAALEGTRQINMHASTDRTSAGPLGLDLTSTVSRLLSDALGLDVDSPTAPSWLSSSGSLGLDVTSAAAASVLRSAAALGLDLTSPNAASVLSSALALGLDVLSGESVSRLNSRALGLDLTSPQAPSTLLSAVALGLDVLSAEVASSLSSSAGVGLDVTSAEASSTLRSTTEINQATTSYGSTTLLLTGSGTPSTSVATLSGVYTGVGTAANATSLTLKVTKNATLNALTAVNARFEIRDQNNAVLFSYSGNLKAGDQVYLGADIGLTLTFSSGTLTNNHTAATTVSHTDTDVNPDAAFNAPVNQRPRFENNAQVTAGSFTVNGTTITVNANDTIRTVLDRITASAAGVTATFDDDRVTLTTTAHSERDIVLAGDTSGFLSAVKLSTATTTRGNVRDDRQTLAQTSQFAGVASGTFTLNGTTIAVNHNIDTLESILNRINAAGAGVTATFDAAQDRVILTGTSASEDLIVVGNDSSGFLAAAHLATSNTVRGNVRDDRQLLSKMAQFNGVTAGSFTINGTTITLDPASDTLESLITRINTSGAGVVAAYDTALDKLTLTGTANSKDLITVSNDSTGFLAAAQLATANTTRGHIAEDGVAFHNLDQFASVADGSFVIDGRTIAVSTADTVQSIVSKINESGARVTASFDPDGNTISLVTTFDTEDPIDIGGDTSGFLSAAGLDAANTVAGNLRDDRQILAKTSQFDGVSSGSFTINGTSITVDVSRDTLESLIARINDAGAGVTAAYDTQTDRLVLTGTSPSQDLIAVGNDGTGFLAAAALQTGHTVRGHLPENGVALAHIAGFQSVQSGHFVIDGRTITVDVATDTVQSIIDRINASGARVTASYDAETDRIALQATDNSEDDLDVGADTSGFLAAAHLDPANTERGNIRDDEQVLAKTSQFGGVTSGTFEVGGRSIAIDVNEDSLHSIIQRINEADAGVLASYNEITDRIEIVGTSDGEDALALGSDTTGFLAAAQLDPANTVRGNLRDDEQVLAKTSQFGGVVSGSFAINGRTITLDAGHDTIQSVIRRINEAGAGVTASFDAASDRIVLVADAAGDSLIALSNDTTGWLAAANLSTANTARGKLADDQTALSRTARFRDVRDGAFAINGTTISVSADADTLETVVARINGAGAGVTARYDSVSDVVTLTPDVAGATLTLDGDTSGFLSAALVAEGTTATRVNADAAFNGIGADAPLFDTGVTVGAGAFTINGVTIDVHADDTINTVLARITASDAGVTARFDADRETVRLVAKDPATAAITVGNDTSGFLAAVKLDGTAANTTATGTASPFTSALARISEYAGVAQGRVTINGRDVTIDPETTTISGLLSALNGIDGVVASLDESTGRFKISSRHPGATLTVSDTSGLFEVLGIDGGTYRGAEGVMTATLTRTGSVPVTNAGAIVGQVSTAVNQLNAALAAFADDRPGTALRTDVENALKEAIDSLRRAGVEGLSVDSSGKAPRVNLDSRSLAQSLQHVSSAHPLTAALTDVFDAIGAPGAAPVESPASAAAPARRTLSFGVVDQAQVVADQAAGTLRLMSFPLQASRPVDTRRAAAAYDSNGPAASRTERSAWLGLVNPLTPDPAGRLDSLPPRGPGLSMTPASKLGVLPVSSPERPWSWLAPPSDPGIGTGDYRHLSRRESLAEHDLDPTLRSNKTPIGGDPLRLERNDPWPALDGPDAPPGY